MAQLNEQTDQTEPIVVDDNRHVIFGKPTIVVDDNRHDNRQEIPIDVDDNRNSIVLDDNRNSIVVDDNRKSEQISEVEYSKDYSQCAFVDSFKRICFCECKCTCCLNLINRIPQIPLLQICKWDACVARFAGCVYSLAAATIAHCWLVNGVDLEDFAFAVLSLLSFVMLNSIPKETLTNTDVNIRNKAILLVGICYFGIFLHLCWSVWKSKTNPICWKQNFLYTCILFFVATVNRFAVPAFHSLWSSQSNHTNATIWQNTQTQCAPACNIVCMVMAALCLVVGMFTLAHCVLFSVDTGAEDYCALAPLPYFTVAPFLIITHQQDALYKPEHTVWTTWTQFLSAFVYLFSIIWPYVLKDASILTADSAKQAFMANIFILTGIRLVICTFKQHAYATSNSYQITKYENQFIHGY